MPKQPYKDLGAYSDLPAAAQRSHDVWPKAAPGEKTRKRFLQALNFNPREPKPLQVKSEGRWERDGISGEFLTWSVGYGPRTEAWLLKPSGATKHLPGIVALHDH